MTDSTIYLRLKAFSCTPVKLELKNYPADEFGFLENVQAIGTSTKEQLKKFLGPKLDEIATDYPSVKKAKQQVRTQINEFNGKIQHLRIFKINLARAPLSILIVVCFLEQPSLVLELYIEVKFAK